MQKQCLQFLELLKRSSAGYVYLFTAPMCMLASNISMVEWCSFSRIDEMDGGLYYSRLDSRFIFHVTLGVSYWRYPSLYRSRRLQDLLHIEARPVTQDPIVSRT